MPVAAEEAASAPLVPLPAEDSVLERLLSPAPGVPAGDVAPVALVLTVDLGNGAHARRVSGSSPGSPCGALLVPTRPAVVDRMHSDCG